MNVDNLFLTDFKNEEDKSETSLKRHLTKALNSDAGSISDAVDLEISHQTTNDSIVTGIWTSEINLFYDDSDKVIIGYGELLKEANGLGNVRSISFQSIANAFSRQWRKRKANFFSDDLDGQSSNSKRRKLSFFSNRKVLTKFLSSSVSKLNIASSPSLEIRKKASNSLQSLTKIFDFSRRRSLSQNILHTTSDFFNGSTQSTGKDTWPIPCLEALFMPEFLNKTMITEDDFTLLNCIGRGAFGCVYQICLKNNPKVVFALKVQKKCEILSQNVANQVKNEASIQMSLCNCAFITKSITCWQSRTKLFTLMQCSGGYGDLRNLWEDFGPFKSSLIRIYAAEIAIALDYCHRNSVIYRDLKLENVTLTVDGHIQITDFGFAKRLADDDRTTTICGTLQYMAPEVAFGQPYSKYIDWWCFGVLLHVLHTGHYPYPNSEAKSHSDLGYESYYSENSDGLLHDLLRQLLDVNLAKRICSYNAVRDHSFFRLFEWDVVAIRKLNPYLHISGSIEQIKCKVVCDELEPDDDDEEYWTAFDEDYEHGLPEYLDKKFNSYSDLLDQN